jgi:hypothetical protein
VASNQPTATNAVPSIKVPLNGSVVVTPTNEASVPQTAVASLQSLENERIVWETTELAASNNRLYGILTKAYSFYHVMKFDNIESQRKALAQALAAFIEARGYKFSPSSHDMTRVVKCVFGVDRRRVSAYSIALREALRQQVAPVDLVAFLEANGGVEQIRLGGTKPLSVTKRAERVMDAVAETALGNFKFDAAVFAADADWTDKQVVIVATYLPTGEFKANAVIKHDGALRTALAAIDSQQNARVRTEAKEQRESEKAEVQASKEEARIAKEAARAEKLAARALKEKEQIEKAEALVAKNLAALEQLKANAQREVEASAATFAHSTHSTILLEELTA